MATPDLTYDPSWKPEGGPDLGYDPDWKPEASNPLRRFLADPAISLLKGVVGVPEAAVGLADIVTGGRAGKFLENAEGDFGFRPKEAKNMLDSYYSPEQKAANEHVQNADGFIDTLGRIADKPSVIPHAILESLPVMGAGGVVSRSIAPLLKSAAIRGAIGEGVIGAGSAAEQVRQETKDGLMTLKQGALPVASGAGTFAFGALGGKLSNRLGIGDVENMLAGGAQKIGKKGMARSAAEGFITEGGFEEAPQSAWEQAMQNIALDRPWYEGVGNATALGAVTGGVMGAGAGGIGSLSNRDNAAPGRNPLTQIAGLLPAPVQTGVEGHDILLQDVARQNSMDAARQNSMDAAQANADKIYAERDAYEAAMAAAFPYGLPQITEPVASVQEKIDEALRIDQSRLSPQEQANYVKTLKALLDTPVGITNDANGHEIPLTMVALLNSQATVETVLREQRSQQVVDNATEQAQARNEQVASEESSIPVVGPLSAAGDMAVKNGAAQVAAQATEPAPEPPAPPVYQTGSEEKAGTYGDGGTGKVVVKHNGDGGFHITTTWDQGIHKKSTGSSFPAGTDVNEAIAQMAAKHGGFAAEEEGQKQQPDANTGGQIHSSSGTYRDGGRWKAEYKTVKRTDGSVSLVRTITDDDGVRKEHLSAEGEWVRGEPAKTTMTMGGPGHANHAAESFMTIKDAADAAIADSADMGATSNTQTESTEPPTLPPESSANPAVAQQQAQTEPGPSAPITNNQPQATSAPAAEVPVQPPAKAATQEGQEPPSSQATPASVAPADTHNAEVYRPLVERLIRNKRNARELGFDIDGAISKAKEAMHGKKQMPGSFRSLAAKAEKRGDKETAEVLRQIADLNDARKNPPKKAVLNSQATPDSSPKPVADVPSLQRPPASWVIKNKATGEVILETYDKKKVDAINAEKYEAIPILEHLQSINKDAKYGKIGATPQDAVGVKPIASATLTSSPKKEPSAVAAAPAVSQKEKAAPTPNNSAKPGVPESGMQERPAARAVTGSLEEPAQSKDGAGSKLNSTAFDAFVKQYVENQPVDAFNYRRELSDLVQEIEHDWNNGNSDEYSGKFGPDQIHAELRAENEAEFYDTDGDLTDAGSDRYNQIETALSESIAKDHLNGPKREQVVLSRPKDMASVLHDFLEQSGVGVWPVSGSGKSSSQYFEIMVNGEKRKVRVSDHALPVEHSDANGAADYEVMLYDIGDDLRRDGRFESEGIGEDEAIKRAKSFIFDLRSDISTLAGDVSNIDAAANEAATSPQNDTPLPTDAQKSAGNYKMGHVIVHGLDITIENPKGSERSGIDADGSPWKNTMASHYGYILGTDGNDGDHVDVFVGDNPESEQVFIVDQKNVKTGAFDEHKVLLGFNSLKEAKAGYANSYQKGWMLKGVIGVTPATLGELKAWLSAGDMKSPYSNDEAPPAETPKTETREIVEHVTARGKTLRGIVRTDLTHEQAKALDKYTFKKNGGYFIRETPAATLKEAIEGKPEAPPKAAEDKSKANAAKLRTAGEKLVAAAESDMGRDRLTNTNKRASQASHAEATAAQNKLIGETMIRIADAIEDGAAGALSSITARTQVERLDSIMRQAKYAADRKNGGHVDQQRSQGRPFEESDLPFVEMTESASWISGAKESLLKAIAGKKGAPDLRDEIRYAPSYTPALDAKLKKILTAEQIRQAVGWYVPDMIANHSRMVRAGIENTAQLREAIKQYAQIRASKAVANKAKELERKLVGQKVGIDFFPTPKSVASDMVQKADIQPGMTVLEPSAGNGNIADAIKGTGVNPDVIELSSSLREILEAKDYNVVGQDFMQAKGNYDRIVMNPPFSNRMDSEHVQHAYELLNPGGRVVAIMGEGVFFGQDKKAQEFREWLDSVGGTSEKLPAGTFSDKTLLATTGTNARLVVIDKADNSIRHNVSSNEKLTPSDKAIYGMAAEGKGASEILKFIAASSRNPFYRQLARILLKTGIAPKITVGDGKGFTFNAGNDKKYAASYNPKTDTVSLFRPASSERHVLHELTHAATIKALSKKGMASVQMRALFNHVKTTGKLHGMYGMENVDEFVAEAFSNPKFQEALKAVGAPSGSTGLKGAWEWFVRIVGGILGLKKVDHNALSAALEIGVGVMHENMRLSEGKNLTTKGNVGAGSTTINVDGVERSRLNSNGKPIAQTDEGIRNFWKWFAGSKVTDDQGRPLVIYHGTAESFSYFDEAQDSSKKDHGYLGRGFYFSTNPVTAGSYANMKSGIAHPNIMPLYSALKNPLLLSMTMKETKVEIVRKSLGLPYNLTYEKVTPSAALEVTGKAKELGYDGVYLDYSVFAENGGVNQRRFESEKEVVAFDPSQIKSASGNNGQFSPDNNDIRYNLTEQAGNQLFDLLHTDNKFNALHKTIATQYHKSTLDKDFKRVFDVGQKFLLDNSRFAMDAADQAPSLLQKLGSLADVFKKGPKRADIEAIAAPIFTGTLDKVLYTDAQLRSVHNLSDPQIALYREFRAGINKSLDDLGASEMARIAKPLLSPAVIDAAKSATDFDTATSILHEALLDHAREAMSQADRARESGDAAAAKKLESNALEAEKTADDVLKKAGRIRQLKQEGYAPLMRFGNYAVDVTKTGEDGEVERIYFGMYETQREANMAARAFRAEYPDANVEQGPMDTESWKLFGGVDPSSLEVFADAVGADESPIFQEYLRLTLNNRSALKRLIKREGIAGFSKDVTRVLSQFVTSNARLSSKNYHFGDMKKAVMDIPKMKGDVKNEAAKLATYLQNPNEEAAGLRGYLFIHYLGGSIASALTNMTQPITMTLPYLAQFGGAARAGAALVKAGKLYASGNYDAELAEAMALAEREGITAPHEIHQLYAESERGLGRNIWVRKGLRAWGAMFSLAESYNRNLTFISAFNMARTNGHENPFAFAQTAIEDTQGIYNKGNRPDWARGTIGATVFTFKQFSISYIEFLSRLYKNDKKAFALAMAIMFMGAGAEGWPFAEDVEDLIDTIGQLFGHSTNSKQWVRQQARQVFGDAMGEFVRTGASAIPGMPIDISGRIGVSNLIPGTAMFKVSETDKARDVFDFIGPVGGLAQSAVSGFDSLRKGDAGAAVRLAAPLAIQNIAKGGDMLHYGAYRDRGGRKVVDTTPVEAFSKAIGFHPNTVAKESSKVRELQQNINQQRRIKDEIADKWAAGIFDKDPEAIREAQAELMAWNLKNPESRIGIAPQQISTRLQAMYSTREQRFIKSAPKEMRGQVLKEIRN